mmetsp:Transcript_69936/g.156894  ORF Transcript_69936/g.156894 Transcript_69936/m.156894 type:complete len:202 (+) Transcript_69936:182-787(+)
MPIASPLPETWGQPARMFASISERPSRSKRTSNSSSPPRPPTSASLSLITRPCSKRRKSSSTAPRSPSRPRSESRTRKRSILSFFSTSKLNSEHHTGLLLLLTVCVQHFRLPTLATANASDFFLKRFASFPRKLWAPMMRTRRFPGRGPTSRGEVPPPNNWTSILDCWFNFAVISLLTELNSCAKYLAKSRTVLESRDFMR